ncbi:MAG: Aspartate aminotransferase [Alphaproteobacteria bacterium MarineAlpha9_Bin7]|nr:MAG: Aspartate aminotransferase [Alphaproteobacteria bacterium MarineAlpha9_Bin7]
MKRQSLKVAQRGKIAPFFAMEMLQAANQLAATGDDILHLEVGEPGFGAPVSVINVAKTTLDHTILGYTEALGMPELRARISRHYKEYYDVEVPSDRVVTTFGASGAFLLAFLAAFDVGDKIAVVQPGYPAYRNILTALGLQVIPLCAGPKQRFQPSVDLLQEVGPINGLIIASPSNPTGTMLSKAELKKLVSWCKNKRVRLISDEIYHGISYGNSPATAASFDDQVIVINSFSKYFAMTGWRLGWMIVPHDLAPSVERLAQNLFVSPASLPQHAALTALDCRKELDTYVEIYARNRAYLLNHLPSIGFERLAPADGAFYLYADVSGLTSDSKRFCQKMLEETGVATTPGIDFDTRLGHRYMRFSFAGAEQTVVEAVKRLNNWRR